MKLFILFKADAGILEFLTTDMLSQNTSAGPSASIPKHLNLYTSGLQSYLFILRAKNSDLKLEASTVFCHLLYRMIGALFTWTMMR